MIHTELTEYCSQLTGITQVIYLMCRRNIGAYKAYKFYISLFFFLIIINILM